MQQPVSSLTRTAPAALGPLALIADYTLIAERKRMVVLKTADSGCELPAIGYIGWRDGQIEGWHWRNANHVTSYGVWLETASGERLLHHLTAGPISADFVATPFKFPAPTGPGELTLRATYASGGSVVIAAGSVR